MKSIVFLVAALVALAACGDRKPGVPLACRDYRELAAKAVACGRLTEDTRRQTDLQIDGFVEHDQVKAEQTCRSMFAGLRASTEGCPNVR